MASGYLTIDDSPSATTDHLVDFLHERNIPALLFCRGDALDANPEPVIRAIQKGFLIGNHTYSHRRASELSTDAYIEDILKCEALIEKAYKQAGRTQKYKTFRFSYLDRGAGAWVIDFDALSERQKLQAQPVFWEGLNFTHLDKPDQAAWDKVGALQDFLQAEGYCAPYKNVALDWYNVPEITAAADSFFTFSSSDWMLTRRHLEKDWPYKSVADLKAKIDRDLTLAPEDSAQILLFHDQSEILAPVCALIEHFQKKDFVFLDF